jgi:phage shock protein PspC (stress-responsive transcriptional regulator)
MTGEFRPPVAGAPESPGDGSAAASPSTSGRRYTRREPEHGYLGGVCAGFAARLGIDPLLIRIGFVAAGALGGVAIPLYAVGWVLIPADGPEKPAVQRLLTRSDTWLVAAGMGCLTASGLLLLRAWDVWFVDDKFLWPLVIAATGGALIWRQSQTAPERVAAHAKLPRQTVNRATAGAALVVGGALIFLYVNDALAPARDVVLPVLVMLVAFTSSSRPGGSGSCAGWPTSAPSASAPRSGPTSPRTCTTRSCRRSRWCRSAPTTRARSRRWRGARSGSCGRGATAPEATR